MRYLALASCVAVCLLSVDHNNTAYAVHRKTVEHENSRDVGYDRHAIDGGRMESPVVQNRYHGHAYRKHQAAHRTRHRVGSVVLRDARHELRARQVSRVVAHPIGCPRIAFCGCGTAVKVFGKPVRSLWLAANWLRFPTAKRVEAGMVAARHGHTFYILKPLAPGLVLAWDPNSGNHQTRIHVRSLAGFRVVDPRRG